MKVSQLVFGIVLLVAIPWQRGEVAQAQNDEAIKLWDTVSGVARDIPLHREDVTSVAFSPNNKLFAAGSATKVINLFEPGTAKKLRVLAGHKGAVQTLSFSPNGRVLASGSWDRTIKLWNVATGQQIASFIGNEAEVLSVAFSPAGNYLASGGGDETVRLWNLSTNRITHLLTGHAKKINSVAFSFDGKFLASGSDDKTIRVWEVETGKLVCTLDGHYGPVESVAFSPHNYTLASSSEDQTVKIWDTFTGKEIFTLKGHLSSVDYVAFSPDGKSLASGSYDKTVKLWDIDSGRELRAFQGHRQRITSLAFAPDGKTLVSASALNRFERPTLHVLAVGITNYYDTSFPVVDFAAKDAQDFAAALENAARTKFERINVSVLTDYGASYQSISVAISKLIENTKPQDVFVLFFAGYASMGFDGDSLDDRFALSPSHGAKITDVLLRSWLSQIEARQQLVILETKDTTKGYEFLIKEFANENKLLRGLLKRDLVLLVNTFQGAPIPKLKNQFLTNGLLDGLSGRAVLESGELTAYRLVEYVKSTHAALPKESLRRAGEITSFTSGKDFQLANFSKPQIPRSLFAHALLTSEAKDLNVQRSGRTKKKRPPTRGPGKKPQRSSEIGNESQKLESAPKQSGVEIKRRGKDYALLIATDKYRNWKPLGNPIRDATALADTLRNYYGFQTEVIKNPMVSEVGDVLEKYQKLQYGDNDQLFIFIAGHGHYMHNSKLGYLVFSDSNSVDSDRTGSSYISYPWLRNMIDNIPCRHILLVIDACYSGTFDETIAKRGPFRGASDVVLPKFIEEKMQFMTRRFITSGSNETVPDGDKNKHSPFTDSLLETLRSFGGQAGYLTIASLEANLQTLSPSPISDKWGQNEKGSEFFFFAKTP
jgi:uncharacterized protein with WD repeat/uncharacterized caspase-like protein